MPIDIESPCGHRPGGSGAACTGAGRTYMFCRLQSSKLAEPPAPAAPPIAVKVPETLALESARALEVDPALEVDVLELEGETFEVEG